MLLKCQDLNFPKKQGASCTKKSIHISGVSVGSLLVTSRKLQQSGIGGREADGEE